MLYQLPPLCYPQFLFNPSIYLPIHLSILQYFYLSIYQSTSSIPYISDPGAGIGLVFYNKLVISHNSSIMFPFEVIVLFLYLFTDDSSAHRRLDRRMPKPLSTGSSSWRLASTFFFSSKSVPNTISTSHS